MRDFGMLGVVTKDKLTSWFGGLLDNSRFWIVASGIVLSVNIAGLVQFLVPSGSLQAIRIEQIFGFISAGLIAAALLASPLTKTFPRAPYNAVYLHARRAIGVLAFYYAFLHVCVSFFVQLGGFDGIKYYSSKYSLAILLGVVALVVLFLMAATSLDWAVRVMSFRRWKLLHRFIYLAGLAIVVHVLLIGSHFSTLNVISVLAAVVIVVLLRFEVPRLHTWVKVVFGSRSGSSNETKSKSKQVN